MNKLEIPIAVLELEILALLSAHKRIDTIPGMSLEQIINFLKPERDLGRESCRRAILALQQRTWVKVFAKFGRTQLFVITEQGESAIAAYSQYLKKIMRNGV
jgi:hypothetical protein